MDVVRRVLDFWFGPEDGETFGQPREEWFKATPAFDKEIRARFAADHEAAARGDLDSLAANAHGSLAVVILLDQFSRNMFRGTPAAFATDRKARTLALRAIGAGFDRRVHPVQREFFYLPLEHSEDPADQELCVRLYTALGNPDSLEWAVKHRDVIVRFGRFPHRNAVLGRENTPEETVFLAESGSSF